MIDLTGAKVGDKYLDCKGVLCEYIGMNAGKVVGRPVKTDGIAMHNTHYVSISDQLNCNKHDPRPWLKDLPDADLFCGGWLAFESQDSDWHVFEEEPQLSTAEFHFTTEGMFRLFPVGGIKMPTLTGDQWKDSKISIPELKTWQLANQ